MLIVFSVSSYDLKKILIALAKERLTQKQKQILVYLQDIDEKINVTNLVCTLSKKLNCSQSAIWNNSNSLRRAYLVEYGTLKEKGKPVKLTSIGFVIADGLIHYQGGTEK